MQSTYTVADYITDLRAIRSTGSATAETSYYPPLYRLFNAVGQSLNPAVLFSTKPRNGGASVHDGGFPPGPKRQRRCTKPELLQNPERGVVEVKPADYYLDTLAAEPHTLRYLPQPSHGCNVQLFGDNKYGIDCNIGDNAPGNVSDHGGLHRDAAWRGRSEHSAAKLLLPLLLLRRRLTARGVWLTASLGLILMAAASAVGRGGEGGSGSTTPINQTHQVTSSGAVNLRSSRGRRRARRKGNERCRGKFPCKGGYPR